MDLKIEKENLSTRMSSLGVLVKDINSTNSIVEINTKKIEGTNRSLFLGATHSEKKITVSGYYYVENELQDEYMKDKLNGTFADTEPFYITKMYTNQSLYGYERPGEKQGFDMLRVDKQRQYHYRYKVLLDGEINYDFQGFSDVGLLYEVSLTFKTVDLPFGITIPDNIEITNSKMIEYRGTVPCSQLEWPCKVQIIAKKNLGAEFKVSIDGREFKYVGKRNILSGDKFLLEGTSFTLNGLNINDQTNIEYFILKPNEVGFIPFYTSFNIGEVEINILNKVDLYR